MWRVTVSTRRTHSFQNYKMSWNGFAPFHFDDKQNDWQQQIRLSNSKLISKSNFGAGAAAAADIDAFFRESKKKRKFCWFISIGGARSKQSQPVEFNEIIFKLTENAINSRLSWKGLEWLLDVRKSTIDTRDADAFRQTTNVFIIWRETWNGSHAPTNTNIRKFNISIRSINRFS